MRRSVFRELGGLDETRGALEDIEFSYRMYRAGHRIFLDNTLEFTHAKKYTWLDLLNAIYAFRNLRHNDKVDTTVGDGFVTKIRHRTPHCQTDYRFI